MFILTLLFFHTSVFAFPDPGTCVLNLSEAARLIVQSKKLRLPSDWRAFSEDKLKQLMLTRSLLWKYGHSPEFAFEMRKRGVSQTSIDSLIPKLNRTLIELDVYLAAHLRRLKLSPKEVTEHQLNLLLIVREAFQKHLQASLEASPDATQAKTILKAIEARIKNENPLLLTRSPVDIEYPPTEPMPSVEDIRRVVNAIQDNKDIDFLGKPVVKVEVEVEVEVKPAPVPVSKKPEQQVEPLKPQEPSAFRAYLQDEELIREIVDLSNAAHIDSRQNQIAEKIKASALPESRKALLELLEQELNSINESGIANKEPTPQSPQNRREAYRKEIADDEPWIQAEIDANRRDPNHFLSGIDLLRARTYLKKLRRATELKLDPPHTLPGRKVLFEQLSKIIADANFKTIKEHLDHSEGPLAEERSTWEWTAAELEKQPHRASDMVLIRETLRSGAKFRREPLTTEEKELISKKLVIDSAWLRDDLKDLPPRIQKHLQTTIFLEIARSPNSAGDIKRSQANFKMFRVFEFGDSGAKYKYRFAWKVVSTDAGHIAIYIGGGNHQNVYKDIINPRFERLQ